MEIEIKAKIKDFYKKLGVLPRQFVWGPRYLGMILRKRGYRYHYFK